MIILRQSVVVKTVSMKMAVKNTISIRNFKGLPSLHAKYPESQWALLEPDLIAILNGNKISHALEDIYRTVDTLHKTNCNCESFMLDNLRTLIETNLLQKLYILLDKEDDFLMDINVLWKNFCGQMRTIRNIFILFEKSPKSNQQNNVHLMSSTLFKNIIVLNATIRKRIVTELLKAIEIERNGIQIDVKLMRAITSMLTDLQTYTEVFHNEFERISEEFYENEGNELIKYYSVSEYLKYTSFRIKEEEERGMNYVNGNTTFAMISIIERKMIGNHVTEILDAGFEKLIEDENHEDLSLMYSLIWRMFGGYNHLSLYFNEYVMKVGNKIMNMTDGETIEHLLEFKKKLNSVIKNCFMGNKLMYEDLRKRFSKFINTQQNRPAQLLAKYVDQKLRAKNINMDELETCLTEIMAIFRLIQGKDIFEAFYKKELAKRLLLGKSASQDAENSMVSKLKYECGSTFTSKIEGMFNDISISSEINSAFKQYLTNLTEKNSIPDLSINILTSSFWPNYPTFKVNLPVEFISYQDLFQKFYSMNHSGRKLLWQPNLGYCILKADFENGKKELQVSLFQTLILLLFNTSVELNYNEIKELTNIDEKELKRTLISLTCGRSRVLLKNPKGLGIEETDKFMLNKQFTDRLFRVRINQVQLKETEEEDRITEQHVLIDRQFQIDAAIVRIMKSCKCISHTNLISELFNKLGIPVKPSDLKRRIELLIEREYMERDKDNPAYYNYIA
ncbi:cullin-4B-like [Harmonia axyridis]|uniref:cullin-4B-like n=1 Tax=Harmonia axyridis TaxID=115357 RepID=UPI001E276C4B|nr:cullin-4B-like [Harmonia axyridis]